MAMKKTKEAPATAEAPAAAAGGANLAAARAARETVAANDRFVYAQDVLKGAPQAKKIIEILKAAGKKGMTRAELVKAMEGQVVTRQPQSRILGYYQKDLVAQGAMTMVKASGGTPVAVAA